MFNIFSSTRKERWTIIVGLELCPPPRRLTAMFQLVSFLFKNGVWLKESSKTMIL